MKDTYLLGIDVGTSGCKALVFDSNGKQIANKYREYSLIFPNIGWMELPPDIVTEAIFDCIRQCANKFEASKITALAVSSQGEAIIPIDMNGTALSNSIVTFDNRNQEEYKWFSEQFDKEQIMKITGAPIHTMFSILKILWIKNNLPEIYDKTWKFMCWGDYISYKLGAKSAIDWSMASRTMAFDISKKEWSGMILDKCGIPLDKMPEAVPSGEIIGEVNSQVSEVTGLIKGTKIVSGGHDQVCCALGAGVLESGVAMDSLGTTESILCVNKELHVTESMIKNNLPCYCYPVNDLYAYLGFLSSSGAILKWYRDEIIGNTYENSYANMDKIITEKYPGYSGLMVLPHFAGSGTPYLDFNSKGVITGLTLGTSKYQIYKAILESVNMEARLNIECMEESGIEIRELYCVGGGAKSSSWLQLKADITGKKVVSNNIGEFGCLGACILAGIGVGVYKDSAEALAGFSTEKKIYLPDEKVRAEYDEVYARYKKLYKAVSVL